MTTVAFWRERFKELGSHSVGPGSTRTEKELEAHREQFVEIVHPWLGELRGPVLDFGCGVGRWTADLPRPYLGLDLLEEHLELARERHQGASDVSFGEARHLATLADESFGSVFTCTVLQHVVDLAERRRILAELARVLKSDGRALFIEWAEGQKDYDWCTALRPLDIDRAFTLNPIASVIESGRRHTVWFGSRGR